VTDIATATHDGVTAESYSDTPEQVRVAIGLQAQEVQTPPAEHPDKDEPVSEQPEPGEPPAESAAGQTLAKKRKSLQDRIDAITREKYDTARERDAAKARADHLERELATLKRGNGQASTTPPPAAPAPASSEKFPKYAEYLQTHPDAELEEWLEARDEWRDARRRTRPPRGGGR